MTIRTLRRPKSPHADRYTRAQLRDIAEPGCKPTECKVLHCFHKTTPKTARADIVLAAKRYKLTEE